MSIPIKGQENQITIVSNGQTLQSTADFVSAEYEFMFDLLTRNYLGMTSEQYDELFKGLKISLELNLENQQALQLVQVVQDRASRRNTNAQINVTSVLNMPNGDRPKIYAKNLFFGAMPIGFANRSAYGTLKLDASCSSGTIKLS